MFDDRFRNLVSRDYQELSGLRPRQSPKSVMVMSGSVIEGVLSDAILATEQLVFEKIINLSLARTIENASALGIITKAELSTVLRSYRNLVHPGVEIRDRIEFDDADATLAKSAVEVIVREVRKWANYYRILNKLTSDEINLLELFGHEPPEHGVYEHPWLAHRVFLSRYSLSQKGVLEIGKEVKETADYTQRVTLSHDAVRYVELIVLQKPTTRTSIKLSFRNIEALNASGSGATGSSGRS